MTTISPKIKRRHAETGPHMRRAPAAPFGCVLDRASKLTPASVPDSAPHLAELTMTAAKARARGVRVDESIPDRALLELRGYNVVEQGGELALVAVDPRWAWSEAAP